MGCLAIAVVASDLETLVLRARRAGRADVIAFFDVLDSVCLAGRVAEAFAATEVAVELFLEEVFLFEVFAVEAFGRLDLAVRVFLEEVFFVEAFGFDFLVDNCLEEALLVVELDLRLRWLRTMAHSSSLSVEGLSPCVFASFAAFSISLIKFNQEVANRLSDWDFAALSTSVSTTPVVVTFLRRRLKISFWSCAISEWALTLSLMVI